MLHPPPPYNAGQALPETGHISRKHRQHGRDRRATPRRCANFCIKITHPRFSISIISAKRGGNLKNSRPAGINADGTTTGRAATPGGVLVFWVCRSQESAGLRGRKRKKKSGERHTTAGAQIESSTLGHFLGNFDPNSGFGKGAFLCTGHPGNRRPLNKFPHIRNRPTVARCFGS